MSAADDKKAKRRKIKKSLVAKNLPRSSTCQNGTEASNLSNSPSETILSPAIDSETLRRLEKLMDASDDADSLELLSLSRGPNPYLDKERCLLCGCERQDPPEAAAYKIENSDCEKRAVETNLLTQLPLWVCPECRKSTDQEMEKKMSSNITGFMDPDLPPEPSSPPFLPEAALRFSSPPNTSNGSMCSCDACKEMREIEAQHDLETQELQNCWTVLRKLVRVMYGRREEDITPDNDTPTEEEARELVDRLCTRDPHQLFLRLESQVREFVIEMKVKLLKQLNSGYKTPPEAKAFISLLLDEYCHLCGVSRKMSEILTKLKTDHLAKFNVTWELHNKHLFQSIAYTEPSIQSSLHLIITQLRMGAASKESYNEDTYPNLLHRYLKFDDEMSVISVVWRDSQQLIEQYNEEQAALKLKQKMLKEDWEFFKAQRTILEQQVAKNDQPLPPHNFEQQFTETMRMMLQGTKPSQEECHCPRCNRKRCPCDECTITHMITCGIINPEALEDQENSSHINFLHDPNRYRIDVSPPSMSSTTSSSGSSSPIMVDHERLTLPFDETGDRNTEEIPEEIEGNSQSDIDDDDEDDDYDDEEDDEEEEEDEDDDEEEEVEDDDDGDNENEDEIDIEDDKNDGLEEQIDNKSISDLSSSWPNDDEGAEELINSEKCDCYHCVSQAKAEQMPPQTPTSKNYAEMRDRLRLRLKKKVGSQGDTKHKDTCSHHHMIEHQPLEDKGSEELEELLHYINGTDNQKEEQEDKQLSAKAAKRARQKQRKAEEKARIEAEKLHQEKLERERELAKNLLNAAKLEESKNEKKKRKKRKQVEEIKQAEIKNGCDKREDPNLVRVPPLGREDTDNKVKNNVKLQVKLSDAPLKSPSTEIKKTVKIVKTDPVKTQRIIVEPLQTNGKVNLKAIKKPDLLKSSPVQPKVQVTKGASQSSPSSAKPVPEQTTKSSGKRKDNKNEKDVDTTEKRMDTGDVKPRKGKTVHNNNDIVVNKNIVQLNGNNNNKTVKKAANTPTPPKSSPPPPQQIKSSPTSSPSSPKKADTQKTKAVVNQSPPQDQQPKGGKKGKNKKKNRNSEDLSVIDEIFLPKSESDLENGELDETEKELEAFKRFCLDYTPVTREKLQVNMNIKDIFVKKKSGLSCT
ncbi:protein FAM193A-like isoform X2 [Mytilus edulis]|uniref:protein FAM193A-like isoform X2 n=1 Tax=Mytilus edulis TaxID=6550 RepID=UPI0039EF1B0E